MSAYNKVTSGASSIPLDICKKDLSWQFNLQRTWEKIVHGKGIYSHSFGFHERKHMIVLLLLHLLLSIV